MINGVQLSRTTCWKIRDEFSLSGHDYIHTHIRVSVQNHMYTRFKSANLGHRKLSMHFGKWILEIQQQLLAFNTRGNIDATTNFLQREIFRCCRKAYKLRKVRKSSVVTWLTQELNIQKKEMRVVHQGH
ncbi:hypothetical protein AVEN_129356-1 [Araneus ventricosus]|uniref:Uncharacterized protein n=1 Tax=Araneus ventricosus TaxID=182803 RepID=A0A4Y2QSE8_ARAVE|nr:hypothetical protein AVEN_129356-1 [Araneus ventricosus]